MSKIDQISTNFDHNVKKAPFTRSFNPIKGATQILYNYFVPKILSPASPSPGQM